MIFNNRRHFRRHRCFCPVTMWFLDGAHETILAEVFDIGLGGLCVRFNQPIVAGKRVALKIDSHDAMPAFQCKATVICCREGKDRVYNIGIEFDPLGIEQQDLLEDRIAQLTIKTG